jgi:hypothetical protein
VSKERCSTDFSFGRYDIEIEENIEDENHVCVEEVNIAVLDKKGNDVNSFKNQLDEEIYSLRNREKVLKLT